MFMESVVLSFKFCYSLLKPTKGTFLKPSINPGIVRLVIGAHIVPIVTCGHEVLLKFCIHEIIFNALFLVLNISLSTPHNIFL